MEITAFKGGNHGEHGAIRWLTTDRDHAAGFGPVATYRVLCSDNRAGHYTVDELSERRPGAFVGGGWEADEAMKDIVREDGYNIAILEDWEGDGVVIWIAKPEWVTVEEVDA